MKAALMLAVNHKAKRQHDDFYATDPWAVYKAQEEFRRIGLNTRIWEPACGKGHLSKALARCGYEVKSTDIVDYGYGDDIVDFLTCNDKWYGDIVTNPPFKLANQFVEHAMTLLKKGGKAVFFLKIQFLETKKRQELFKKCGLKYVLVNSERVCCAMNGDFDKYFKQKNGHYTGGTQLYAWFVFEKGYSGETILRWI